MIKLKTFKLDGSDDENFNTLLRDYNHLGKDGIKINGEVMVVFYEDGVTSSDKIKKLKGELNTSIDQQFTYEMEMNKYKSKMDAIADPLEKLYQDTEQSYIMTINMLKLEIATTNTYVAMLKNLGVDVEVVNTVLPPEQNKDNLVASPFKPDKEQNQG